MNPLVHIRREVTTVYYVIYAQGTKQQAFNNLRDAQTFKKVIKLMEGKK